MLLMYMPEFDFVYNPLCSSNSFFCLVSGELLALQWKKQSRSNKPVVLGLERKRSSTKINIWQSTMQVRIVIENISFFFFIFYIIMGLYSTIVLYLL